jgi:APA family basic amino acid/polyamine antiporter
MLAPMTMACALLLSPRMTAQYSVLSGSMAGRWRIKSVEQSIADTDDPSTQLRKDLSWWHLVVFGVSVVIGAGIFTVTASTAGDITGPAIWISFLISAFTCGLAALCYAEFASMLPVAGSAYTFSYATFGEFLAWTIGWNLVLELAIGGAVVAKGWSSYLSTVFGLASDTIDLGLLKLDWGSLLIVALVATLLALGTKLSSQFSAVVTTIKVSVVLLVIVVGAFYIKTANYSPFIPPAETDNAGSGVDQSLLSLLTGAHSSHYGWYGVLAGASIVFFAFIGFDIVATMAEETKNPQRDVPRGILATLGIVTVLYVAVSVVLSGMVPYTALKTTPDGRHSNLASAFAIDGVHWASGIISVGALAGLTTVVMVLLLGGCRVLFAMARDGLLPRQLAKTGSRGTPVRITVLVALLVGATASAFPTDKLEEMVNVGTLFAFLLVSAGVIVLRRARPDLPRGFRVPLVPVLPIASVLACLWLMVNLTVITWVRFLVWMAAGIAIYLGYGRRHSALASRQAAEPERDTTLDLA